MKDSLFESIPKINAASITLIKTISLPDFILRSSSMKPDYSFLASLMNYKQYYTEYETTDRFKRDNDPAYPELVIEKVGYFLPRSRRHTMNSFWKYFRRRYEIEQTRGVDRSDLFMFLPLEDYILMNKMTVRGIEFHPVLNILLFPFGVCCINLNIMFKSQSLYLDEFIDFVRGIEGAKLSAREHQIEEAKVLRFGPLSNYLAQCINDKLFGEGGKIIPFSSHTMMFLYKTSERLNFNISNLNLRNQALGLAALLSFRKDINVEPDEKIDKTLRCKLAERKNEEILLFTPSRSLFYPSHYWIDEKIRIVRKRNPRYIAFYEEMGDVFNSNKWTRETLYDSSYPLLDQKVERSVHCMHDNYKSFLNVMFASNRFLTDILIPNKSKLNPEHCRQLYDSFSTAFFLDADESTDYYYKHAIQPVGNEIGLFNRIREI